MAGVPEGFELMEPFGPIHRTLGPIYFRRGPSGCAVGMRVEERHHNKGAMLHGGMLAFFVDTAFTFALFSGEPPLKVVTTHLSVDFAGRAAAGDWIEAHVDVMRSGKRVAFVNCFVDNAGERIARASATFQVLGTW